MKILADQNIPFAVEAFSTLAPDAQVVLFDGRKLSAQELDDAEVLMVRSVTKVNEALLVNSKIRFVGSATIGTDHIDLNYLKQRGIRFANAPGSNATSASEYVLCSLLKYMQEQAIEFSQLDVAVVGYGNVGSRVAKKLNALGIKTHIYDPPKQLEQQAVGNNDVQYVDWQQVKSANVVTAHVPLTRDGDYPTFEMFNAEFFSALPDGGLFINTSRGDTVDERALLVELERKKIHLILDVWKNEPLIDKALFAKTMLATTHIAGYSYDGKCRGTEMIYLAACDFLGIAPLWNAAAQTAMDEDSNRLKFTSASVEGLRDLLEMIYPIEQDSLRLAETMDLPDHERAQKFDWLRKHYPKRREFSCYQIERNDLSAADANMLEQLGFSLLN